MSRPTERNRGTHVAHGASSPATRYATPPSPHSPAHHRTSAILIAPHLSAATAHAPHTSSLFTSAWIPTRSLSLEHSTHPSLTQDRITPAATLCLAFSVATTAYPDVPEHSQPPPPNRPSACPPQPTQPPTLRPAPMPVSTPTSSWLPPGPHPGRRPGLRTRLGQSVARSSLPRLGWCVAGMARGVGCGT